MAPHRNRGSSSERDELELRVLRLGLHGLASRWSELGGESWIEALVEVEEQERAQRSLERRVRNAKIGRFKPICDFDWSWPRKIDRELVEDLFRFDFLAERANVVLIGPNGVGKSTLAQNLAHEALIRGSTVRFASASAMLAELSSQDGPSALERRLRRYLRPALLVIDEVGYLSYNAHHADLLFDIVNRRNQDKSTVVTTNKPFAQWNEVFPNSSSVVALVDRLVHRSEIVEIDGDSYRLKEATERKEDKRKKRAARKKGNETRKEEVS